MDLEVETNFFNWSALIIPARYNQFLVVDYGIYMTSHNLQSVNY